MSRLGFGFSHVLTILVVLHVLKSCIFNLNELTVEQLGLVNYCEEWIEFYLY